MTMMDGEIGVSQAACVKTFCGLKLFVGVAGNQTSDLDRTLDTNQDSCAVLIHVNTVLL